MTTVFKDAEEVRYAEIQLMALDYARQGETDSLRPMLWSGLPVNLSDHKGNSLLMLASYHGHLETARLLLDLGASVDRRNDRRQTPLGGAAFKGDTKMVALLVERGAALDADNGNGMTPIMFAALFGRTEVVKQLQAGRFSTKRRAVDFFLGVVARFASWGFLLVKPLLPMSQRGKRAT